MKDEVKKEAKKIKPLVIETLRSTAPEKKEFAPMQEKEVHMSVPVAGGHIRCIVLKDYEGMIDYLYVGDVVDLPERRYKSLVFRGFVEEYKGNRAPNKMR